MSDYSQIRNTNRLMLITNTSGKYTEYNQAKMFYEGGGTWLQLRMKDHLDIETAKAISQLKVSDPAYVFCMNDNLEMAIKCHAKAIHLGKHDMPVSEARKVLSNGQYDFISHIGATANTLEDIFHADKEGASYIGLGPYRYTQTKKNLSPILGLESYRKIINECRKAGCTIPIVAVGGICLEDVGPLFEAGVNGIAVSGAIVNMPDPVESTGQFLSEIKKYSGDKY